MKAAPRSNKSSEQHYGTKPRVSSGDAKVFSTMHRSQSDLEIQKYAEDANDADFSDIFGKDALGSTSQDLDSDSEQSALAITSKMSASWVYLPPHISAVFKLIF